MVTIREPNFHELVTVASRLREADMRELRVTRKDLDRPVKLATAAWTASVYRRLALWEKTPAMAFGASQAPGGSVQVWGFGTVDTARVIRTVTKFVIRSMIPELLGRGVPSARAIVHPENRSSQAWLQHLGFKPEATLTGLGDRQEEMILYAVSANDVSLRKA